MPRTFQSPIGVRVWPEPTVTGYAATIFSVSKKPSMFVFTSTFTDVVTAVDFSGVACAAVSSRISLARLRRRRRHGIASRFAIKRQRFESELIIMSVDFARAEVGAIEKHLEPCRRFDLGVAALVRRWRGFSTRSWVFLCRERRDDRRN